MTAASRETEVYKGMAWDSCVLSPAARVFKRSECKHCFGKELTELVNGSDNDVIGCGYREYRLQADSYAAIDMGEPETTPVIHAVISDPTSSQTSGETHTRLASMNFHKRQVFCFGRAISPILRAHQDNSLGGHIYKLTHRYTVRIGHIMIQAHIGTQVTTDTQRVSPRPQHPGSAGIT